MMNGDGGDMEMLTSGEGDVSNPSWSPNGQFIAFAWTRGYEIGEFNIFVMDVAKRVPVQLTHGNGRNENPWWATGRRAPGVHHQTRQLDPDLHHARRWYARATAHNARE